MRPRPMDTERFDPFARFGEEWALLTAGREGDFNTMTVSWGGFGVLWDRDVCFCVVRPTRHTYGYVEREDGFTLSFFGGGFREALELCGSVSGRERDKVKEAGLTPWVVGPGRVAFREASVVYVCRKLYADDLDPSRFLDPAIGGFYPGRDYHRLYVAEVERVVRR